MRIASLAMALGVIGFCIPAHAGLIGSTVDIRHLFPDQATVNIEGGPATVSGAVEYPLFFSFSVDITDTQILAKMAGARKPWFLGNRIQRIRVPVLRCNHHGRHGEWEQYVSGDSHD